MAERHIRIFKKLDLAEVKKHLLIYGALSGQCGNCEKIDIPLETIHCPGCNTEVKYIAFRELKSNMPKLHKLAEQRPSLTFVDCDDYKRNIAAVKAQEFLK